MSDPGMEPSPETLSLDAMAHQILEDSPIPTFVLDSQHRVVLWNRACTSITGIAAADMLGSDRHWSAFHAEHKAMMSDMIVDGVLDSPLDTPEDAQCRPSTAVNDAYETELFFPHLGSEGRWLYFSATALRDAAGAIIGAIETVQDMTQRHCGEDELRSKQKKLEALVEQRTMQLASVHKQLTQSEKLASIGQLAAGVAHEINNPIGYVHSNIGTLKDYVSDLFQMLEAYETAESSITCAQQLQDIKSLQQSLDMDFLKVDIPMLIRESAEGISRVKKIVQDLKDFSRVDNTLEWQWIDLHKCIDSAINIVANEVKYKADIVRDYGELPDIECLPSQLGQVFMNLLVNAAQAMENERGLINISSGVENEEIWVNVRDNGCGISDDIRQKLFDPFFTTKPVGKGTGLGLSVSYGIVQNHNGRLEVESEYGVGTSFRVVLPRKQPGNDEPLEGRR